ncbi:organic hydroperoxide resistance protein [Mesorhizobium sp. M0659]|uniref:organic hydroperoxide resistance protein n=1 Tax=Mesorhizobium sp. M0659 TaxID=2956980 RepID=UPI0033376B56
MKPEKILYEIGMTATGGREGYVTGPGLDEPMKLSLPKSMGGSGGDGTNPEKLFASGYAACFLGAVRFVARSMKTALPETVSVTATIGIGPIEIGYALAARLEVAMPGVDRDLAVEIVEAAHQRCPYSNATRGNIDVELVVM